MPRQVTTERGESTQRFQETIQGAQQLLQGYPPYVLPYAQELLRLGYGLTFPGGQPAPAPYPYEQVAPLTLDQIMAIHATRTLGPFSPLLGAAQQTAGQTITGGFLSPQTNPFLQQYFAAAASPMVAEYQFATSPDILARGAETGTLVSSGMVQANQLARYNLGRNLAELAAKIYEPAYQAERGLQMEAALRGAPGLVQAQYIPIEQLSRIGSAEQQQAQQILNVGAENLKQQGLWPYQALSELAGVIPVGSGPGVQQASRTFQDISGVGSGTSFVTAMTRTPGGKK
jgi:hypothetical protein